MFALHFSLQYSSLSSLSSSFVSASFHAYSSLSQASCRFCSSFSFASSVSARPSLLFPVPAGPYLSPVLQVHPVYFLLCLNYLFSIVRGSPPSICVDSLSDSSLFSKCNCSTVVERSSSFLCSHRFLDLVFTWPSMSLVFDVRLFL